CRPGLHTQTAAITDSPTSRFHTTSVRPGNPLPFEYVWYSLLERTLGLLQLSAIKTPSPNRYARRKRIDTCPTQSNADNRSALDYAANAKEDHHASRLPR
ncbi:hypothetical protein, partial [Microvirga sp. KLBC 81]|uniref:hypothetical protein n=1 Tax=Microvirga sp. KLBC 81 TaxID=1862707 RepID=UPI00197C65D5